MKWWNKIKDLIKPSIYKWCNKIKYLIKTSIIKLRDKIQDQIETSVIKRWNKITHLIKTSIIKWCNKIKYLTVTALLPLWEPSSRASNRWNIISHEWNWGNEEDYSNVSFDIVSPNIHFKVTVQCRHLYIQKFYFGRL